MSEICNNCGRPEREHEREYESNACGAFTFTARPDEVELTKDVLSKMTPAEIAPLSWDVVKRVLTGETVTVARPDEPKGDKGNENAAVNNYAHKHYNDSSRMLGYVDGYKDAANEYNRQLQAERKRREDERKRMCRELIAIRHDESRHVAGNYYENWTAGRWRAVNEWIAKEFASELAQDSSRTGDPGADLSADHPESSE